MKKQEDNIDRLHMYWSKFLNNLRQSLETIVPPPQNNLRYIFGFLERWRLRLIEYEDDIVHRVRNKGLYAEALIRLPTEATDDLNNNDETPVIGVSTHEQNGFSKVPDIASDKTLIEMMDPRPSHYENFIGV